MHHLKRRRPCTLRESHVPAPSVKNSKPPLLSQRLTKSPLPQHKPVTAQPARKCTSQHPREPSMWHWHKGYPTTSRGRDVLLFGGGEGPNSRHSCTHDKNYKCCKQTDKIRGNEYIKDDITVRHQHPKFGTSQGTLSDSKGRKNTGNGPLSSASYNYFLPFTGFNTLKLHMRVSSMLIMAPALSNSPQ